MKRSGMKNLKIGNYTEFRNISDGLYFRRSELKMTNLGFAKVSTIQPLQV